MLRIDVCSWTEGGLASVSGADWCLILDCVRAAVLQICTLGKPPWGAFGVVDIVEGKQRRDHNAAMLNNVYRHSTLCLLGCFIWGRGSSCISACISAHESAL